jgi:hypothetical protein
MIVDSINIYEDLNAIHIHFLRIVSKLDLIKYNINEIGDIFENIDYHLDIIDYIIKEYKNLA